MSDKACERSFLPRTGEAERERRYDRWKRAVRRVLEQRSQ